MTEVTLQVDMTRRDKLRRLHTATHIINHSARQVLGNHVWQNGSNLKPEFGILDITHYELPTQEQLFEIEKLANKVVFENKQVTIEELSRADAEKKYGYTVYQGGAIPMEVIRIIHVDDSDIEACGGTHMEKTGGIGLIKMVDAQKIQDGVVRLKYVVEQYALDLTHEKEKVLSLASAVFSVSAKDLVKTSEKFFNEWKEQKKSIEKLQETLKQSYLESSKGKSSLTLEGEFDMGFLMELFQKILKENSSFILDSQRFTLATSDKEVKEFKKEIKKGNFSIYVK